MRDVPVTVIDAAILSLHDHAPLNRVRAASAAPALVAVYNDTKSPGFVRDAVARVLQKIDPKAAERNGIFELLVQLNYRY